MPKHKLFAFIIVSLALHFVCIWLVFKPQQKFILIANDHKPSIDIELMQIQRREQPKELPEQPQPSEQAREQPRPQLKEQSNDLPRAKAGSTYQTVSYTHGDLGIKITYPRLSRLLKEEGKVVLSFKKNSLGNNEPLVLLKSSGFQRLDRAALEALTQYKSHPIFLNLNPNSELKVSFTFQLKH